MGKNTVSRVTRVECFNINATLTTDPTVIANEFSKYFSEHPMDVHVQQSILPPNNYYSSLVHITEHTRYLP